MNVLEYSLPLTPDCLWSNLSLSWYCLILSYLKMSLSYLILSGWLLGQKCINNTMVNPMSDSSWGIYLLPFYTHNWAPDRGPLHQRHSQWGTSGTVTCSHFWRCSQHVFTSLASPRPVFASLDLSQLPYRCPSLAMSSGWSSPEFLLLPESLCCHQSSFSFRVPCPWSSLSLEFLILGVPHPQSSSEILHEASSCLPRAFPLFPYDFIFSS